MKNLSENELATIGFLVSNSIWNCLPLCLWARQLTPHDNSSLGAQCGSIRTSPKTSCTQCREKVFAPSLTFAYFWSDQTHNQVYMKMDSFGLAWSKSQLRCCGRTWNEQFMLENPQMSQILKQFCMKEWAKIPPQRCQRLINNYRKHVVAVIAAKDI